MHDFKVGDRVEVVAADMAYGSYGNGDILTIKSMGSDALYMEEFEAPYVRPREVRHITPAPDLITINRADLPDVRPLPSGLLRVNGSNYHDLCTAAEWRESADCRLALAEFLGAREKAAEEAKAAEKEAAEKLNKRRDELAKEVAKRACYVNYQNFTYEDHVPAAQAAINMFIELEDPRG